MRSRPYAFKEMTTIPYHVIFSWGEQVVLFAFPAFSDIQVPMSGERRELGLLRSDNLLCWMQNHGGDSHNIYQRHREYPKVCVNLQTDVR